MSKHSRTMKVASFPFDEEEEEEEKIRKPLFMSIVGIGLMGLVEFGAKKLMNMLSRDKDQDLGAGDVVGDGIDTANSATHAQAASGGSCSQATAQASFDASANASSQSSSNAFAMFTVGTNPAAMTGTQ